MGSANQLALLGLLAVIFCISIIPTESASKPCNLRETTYGQVCVCNATYCDTFEESLTPSTSDDVIVVSTGPSGAPFAVTHQKLTKYDRQPIKFNGSDNVIKSKLTVNDQTKFQTIVGFGGAHTGAVTYLLQQLPQSLQDSIYESYYSATKGLGYTITRVPIGGCDFDLAPWAYNESPVNDKKLSNFTQLNKHDMDRIDQIRRLKLVSGQKNIKYLGAAWSSPKWMKSSNDWVGASQILPQYYDTWAEYHVRYLELMKAAGFDYWAISTGNEPLDGDILSQFVPFMNLGWTAEHQAKFVAEYLGPKLQSSSASNVKILAGDDQRYIFPWWFQEMEAANATALDYLYGFAVHFYANPYTLPEVFDETKKQFPSKVIINTESCEGSLGEDAHVVLLGSWSRAQDYVLSYMQDLRHSVSGWVDWNLILDTIGGPNYVQNYVDAPIITNATAQEIYKQPLFYVIGHFSRFIPENSVRIDVTTTNGMIKTIGFRRPDGNIVLVNYNQYILPIELTVVDGSRKFVLTIPPSTVQTVVYRSLNLY